MLDKVFKLFTVPAAEYEAIGTYLDDVGIGYELVGNRTDTTNDTDLALIIAHDPDGYLHPDTVQEEVGLEIVMEDLSDKAV